MDKIFSNIKGVIFDMDGVLCDSEPFILEAAIKMFADNYHQVVQPEDFLQFVGAGEDRYIGGVAKKYSISLNLKTDKECTYNNYLEMIKGQLQPMHGVKEFISECRKNNYKLAVATSADLIKMTGNLKEIGLPSETFDACINGLDVINKKPNPEIFIQAADKLNLPSSECIVIADAPNGIQAAIASGARCIGLTSSFSEQELLDSGANFVAPDLAALLSLTGI